MEHLFGGITPSSRPQIGRYIFYQLDERNAMVKSVLAFEKVRESAKPTLAGSAPEISFSLPKHEM
jgi:hypothetical protein